MALESTPEIVNIWGQAPPRPPSDSLVFHIIPKSKDKEGERVQFLWFD